MPSYPPPHRAPARYADTCPVTEVRFQQGLASAGPRGASGQAAVRNGEPRGCCGAGSEQEQVRCEEGGKVLQGLAQPGTASQGPAPSMHHAFARQL